jgi:hypothetical protein
VEGASGSHEQDLEILEVFEMDVFEVASFSPCSTENQLENFIFRSVNDSLHGEG